MRAELIVAGKEFRDHLTSKRFIAIFAILLLLSVYSLVTGLDSYHKTLDDYKKNQQQNQQQQWYQDQITALNRQIQDARDRGAPEDEIAQLQYQLDSLINPPMPSVLTVFVSLNAFFSLIGMVLAASMGFDLITREKEEGSLKSLLSHPVYRDAVINGKTIGAFSVLALVLAAAFLITLAIMLFFGIVPTADDLLRIAAYFVMALVFCLAIFAIALMASTLAKNSSMAILFVLGIVIALSIVSMFSYSLATLILGPPPVYYAVPVDSGGVAGGDLALSGYAKADPGLALGGNGSDQPVPSDMPVPLPEPYTPDDNFQQYYERMTMIQNAINAISPWTNFGSTISNAILYQQAWVYGPYLDIKAPGGYGIRQPGLWDSLASVWVNILALFAEMIIAFAVSYVAFLRADIR